MIVESPRGAIRAKARVTDAITPGVFVCQHGWWQDCKRSQASRLRLVWEVIGQSRPA